jgi:tRNA(fMet)-specific endonuclease VapC
MGPNDMLIAAHALAAGLTVVTDNSGEFSRVPGLTVENWLER